MSFFPLFIDLTGRQILVVGAGKVAGRRIGALVESGASVTVVGLSASDTVRRLADQGALKLVESGYEAFRGSGPDHSGKERDKPVSSYFMVLAATGDETADRLAAEDARRMKAFVNVAGNKEESDFYFPGIARAGGITAGITAGGMDHRLAKEATERVNHFLRQNFEDKKSEE